jgi:hypothetical protein
MDQNICARCCCSITDAAGIVTVKVTKEQTYCSICWNGVKPRWFRRIKKYFPMQNLNVLMSPYIHFDLPRRLIQT